MVETNSDKLIFSARKQFTERYGKAYTSLMCRLMQLITEHTTGSNKFLVVGLEAGIGKSIETDRIVAEHVKENQWGRRFLIVRRFKEDVTNSANRINEQCGSSDVALGITHENWSQFREDLSTIQSYPVVIITHRRYYQLGLDPQSRKFFERGRHTLIIDEQIDIPIFSFSEQSYGYFLGKLPRSLHEDFRKACQGLFNELELLAENKVNCLVKVQPKIDNLDLTEQLVKDVDANIHYFRNSKDANEVKDTVESLTMFYASTCLYDQGRISTFNRNFTRWTLENNIILDANAGIDKRYKYAPNIEVYVPKKIIDHSNTTLHHILHNCSRASIKATKNYYPEICKAIIERHSPNDKTLIVTFKEAEKDVLASFKKLGINTKCIGCGDDYDNEDYALAHFGNIVGKNHWRDFNQVWIIANPLIPMEVYPLFWCSAAQSEIGRNQLKMFTRCGLRFKNPKFENIREGCIVSEIYQAIKRINRNGDKVSSIFIVHNDKDVIEKVAKQLKNVQIGETIDLDFESCKKSKTNLKVNKASELAALLRRSSPGHHPKGEFRAILGIDKSNFSKLCRDQVIKKMVNDGLIEIYHKTIYVKSNTEIFEPAS